MDQVYLVLLGILAVVGLHLILASFFAVRRAEAAVITRFGKFPRVAEPGRTGKARSSIPRPAS